MAEYGAHITGLTEDSVPSIFEVLAQENLISSLRPALKYAFKVIAQNYPARFGWLYSLGDEIYTVMDLVLEHYYLKHYSASFAENFYGMKRVPFANGQAIAGVTKLSLSNLIRSLTFLVLVPYVKYKCDRLFEKLREDQDRGIRPSSPFKLKLCAAFLAVYPYVHSIWEGLHFICNMAFVFGKLKFHSPSLKWSGVILHNLTREDIERQQTWEGNAMDLSNKSMLHKVLTVLSRGLTLSAVVLSHTLSLGVFFLQFLEWWYTSDQRTASITALPVPTPPQKETRDNLPRLNSICPLCQKMRTNDTVLAVTGYVFCYPCVYRYVKENHSCPVTALPAKTEHLIRLYQPDS